MYTMNTFDFTSKLLIVILICNMSKNYYKKKNPKWEKPKRIDAKNQKVHQNTQ